MGTSELNACGGEPSDGLASHPGGSRNTSIASCCRNQDKLRPDGPLGLNAGFLSNCFLYVINVIMDNGVREMIFSPRIHVLIT